MGRYNGSFRYKMVTVPVRDPDTGFYTPVLDSGWIDGCECQIETFVPARQKIGVDGQVITYTYEVFIPKHFTGVLTLTARMQLIGEDGNTDEITIMGVNNFNRKYIAVWG